MEFNEEGMEVFKRAIQDFIAAGEEVSFELAGKVIAAARLAVSKTGYDEEEELIEDEIVIEEGILIRNLFSASDVD